MKRYEEFINELKSSTYYSAADKLKDNAPGLSDRFKEHGDTISFKEKMDKLFELDQEMWLYLATKEEILSKRDETKIHPLLLELEKGGYFKDYVVFWDGAGMDKKSIFQDDVSDEGVFVMSVNGVVSFVSTASWGMDDLVEMEISFDVFNAVGLKESDFDYTNFAFGVHMDGLPRNLAKRFFNSSFLKKNEGDTWHIYWDDRNKKIK